MSYYDFLSSFHSSKRTFWIDNKIFRLHYKLNVWVMSFLALFATYQMSGSPIDCSVDIAIDPKVMNTYCWIESTYTLPERLGHEVGRSVIAPGVGARRSPAEPEHFHTYYQWVVFVLVFQTLLFYLPHYIWKSWENGRLAMLINGLKRWEARDISKEIHLTSDFLSRDMANNNLYYLVYGLCESLNLVNVIAQIFFMDMFLGYEFTTYGTKVLSFLDQDSSERIDPMDRIFPKVTKCTFHRYGPSGNIVNYDGLCVLALNILHEKIYIFLWFWFILLAVITGLGFIYRLVTLFVPAFRTSLLRNKVVISTMPTLEDSRDSAVEVIMNRLSPGDWFILYQLGNNLGIVPYQKLVFELARKFGWKEPKVD